MENVTITLYVRPSDLSTLLTVLKILDTLSIENDYVWTPSDVDYMETFNSSYTAVNVPVELYMNFIYSYRKLSS